MQGAALKPGPYFVRMSTTTTTTTESRPSQSAQNLIALWRRHQIHVAQPTGGLQSPARCFLAGPLRNLLAELGHFHSQHGPCRHAQRTPSSRSPSSIHFHPEPQCMRKQAGTSRWYAVDVLPSCGIPSFLRLRICTLHGQHSACQGQVQDLSRSLALSASAIHLTSRWDAFMIVVSKALTRPLTRLRRSSTPQI
jgi:hypothetical protein